MAEDNNFQNISHGLLVFRKAFRFLAGFCIVIFIIFFVAGIINIFINSESIDVSFPGIFVLCIPAYLFWKIPDWLIKFNHTHIEKMLNDPSKEVQKKNVSTDYDTIKYREITDRDFREKYITEDQQGRVIFDSTQRSLRLIFGGAFFVIFLIIGTLITYFSDNIGYIGFLFLGLGILYFLAALGYVYEVTINKSLGIADRKAGWFLIVFKRRFNLTDFSQVVVGSTFYREYYNSIRSYQSRSRDPKFSIYLIGKKVLRLRIFSRLTDARHMGEEISAYLNLPLEEESKVVI